jgi:hypothetical protein
MDSGQFGEESGERRMARAMVASMGRAQVAQALAEGLRAMNDICWGALLDAASERFGAALGCEAPGLEPSLRLALAGDSEIGANAAARRFERSFGLAAWAQVSSAGAPWGEKALQWTGAAISFAEAASLAGKPEIAREWVKAWIDREGQDPNGRSRGSGATLLGTLAKANKIGALDGWDWEAHCASATAGWPPKQRFIVSFESSFKEALDSGERDARMQLAARGSPPPSEWSNAFGRGEAAGRRARRAIEWGLLGKEACRSLLGLSTLDSHARNEAGLWLAEAEAREIESAASAGDAAKSVLAAKSAGPKRV